MTQPDQISIQATSRYLIEKSLPESDQFVFAYTITIKNKSSSTIQLLSRHWVIVDANGKHEEVIGEGVIGEQPTINSGESYTYSSGAILETEVGTMTGFYEFKFSDDSIKKARIPRFTLSVPRTLH